jgi:hypothetical protein
MACPALEDKLKLRPRPAAESYNDIALRGGHYCPPKAGPTAGEFMLGFKDQTKEQLPFPFQHSQANFILNSLDIAAATIRQQVYTFEQRMRCTITKSFVVKILPLTPFSGKIWEEFLAKTMIPQDRGGGGYTRPICRLIPTFQSERRSRLRPLLVPRPHLVSIRKCLGYVVMVE